MVVSEMVGSGQRFEIIETNDAKLTYRPALASAKDIAYRCLARGAYGYLLTHVTLGRVWRGRVWAFTLGR